MGVVVGLAGVGRIGSFHARVLASNPEVDSLLIADADQTRAERTAAEVRGRCVPSPDLLLKSGIDALVIATPTPTHARLIEQAAAAGLPVFCEKPIALDLETTDAVLEQVERARIVLQVGFQRRFDPGYQSARMAVTSGGLGDLYLVRVAAHDPEPPTEDYIQGSGGIWRDLVIHDFDAIPWVTGQQVVEVYAVGTPHSEVFANNGDLHHGVATLRLSAGALVVLTTSRHDPSGYDIRMELFGSEDSIAIGVDQRTPLRSVEPDAVHSGVPSYRDFLDRFAIAYRAEMEAFLRAVQGGSAAGCTGPEARRALTVAIAAERSVAEGRPMRLDEIA